MQKCRYCAHRSRLARKENGKIYCHFRQKEVKVDKMTECDYYMPIGRQSTNDSTKKKRHCNARRN